MLSKLCIGIALEGFGTSACSNDETGSRMASLHSGDGSRAALLVAGLEDGALKDRLQACVGAPLQTTNFSIGHRGAPLGYAEHTAEGYAAAAEMGAGYIECDVTFTADQQLVCRHSQCDLHTTTNILATPLAEKCSIPPDLGSATPYSSVRCCASDITLAEFKTLEGRMDAGNERAGTVEEYLSALPSDRTELVASTGTLLSHSESIELFKTLDVNMIPELKEALVPLPFGDNYTQSDYAQAIVNDYISAGVEPQNVVLQSFDLNDLLYWLEQAPEFGRNATWLDGRYRDASFDIRNKSSWSPSMQELRDMGVTKISPPLWMLLALDENDELVASEYSNAASEAGLSIIPWTLERSGPLAGGGGWYYQTVNSQIQSDSDLLRVIEVLANDVEISAVFSDWPATSTFYANCSALE